MISPRKMLKQLFRPEVRPDPRLERALDEVDRAAADFERAVQDAHHRGLFTHLQEAIIRSTEQDGERIRRRRR